MSGKPVQVIGPAQRHHVHAQISQQTFGHAAVAFGCIERLGSSVGNKLASVYLKLVAPSVATEIVVVVQDQDACVRLHTLTIEMRRTQPTNARTHDDQVVQLGLALRVLGVDLAIPRLVVRDIHGSRMTAPQPDQPWGIGASGSCRWHPGKARA